MASGRANAQGSEGNAAEPRRSSWALAVMVSLGLHALVVWAVSNAARPTSAPMERIEPLSVYLLPPPSPPVDTRALEPEPDPAPEPPEPDAHEEPSAAEPPRSDDRPPSPIEAPTEAPSEGPRQFRYAEPERRSIDWNALISRAVTRLREEEQPSYRSFGFPEPLLSSSASRPREDPRPGEIVRLGGPAPQQAEINENCYYDVYLPGSPLDEAHRFSNSMVSCKPGADPGDTRNDLFLDAKPPYLE